MEINVPEHTLDWVRVKGADASPAKTDTQRVEEFLRLTERQQRILTETWGPKLEAEFEAYRRSLDA